MKNPRPLIETRSRKYLLALAGAVAAATALAEMAPSYLPVADDILQLDRVKVVGRVAKNTYAVERSLSATKTDTALVDVPQSVTVVTRELIDDQAMRGISDLTRYVPGVGIAQGEGNRDTPVMRGNSTTADFFVDGIRDDVQYFRDLYNVDRVEVLKGPNALIFGRGGSGGVINRVTKQAMGKRRYELSLQAGSWEQYRATLDAGEALNDRFAYRVTAMHEDSGSFRDGVHLRRTGANPTFAWALAPHTTLHFGYEYFHDARTADRGVPSFQGRPVAADPATFFGDPDQSQTWAKVNSAFAVLEHQFAHGVSLRNQTRFGSYAKFYQNVFPGALNAAGTSVAISAYNNATDRDNLFNQTDLVFRFDTGPVHHQVLAGLELGRQATDNLRLTGFFRTVSPTTTSVLVPLANPRTTLPLTFAPGATDADNHGVAKTVAVYVQDQAQLLPRLQAVAGLRLERFAVDFLNNRTGVRLENTDQLLSPRAGLVFKATDHLAAYTSYSRSYVPRAGEQLSSLSLTNRSLDPEQFTNYEIGLKWDVRPDFALTAATYRLDRSNVVVPDPADATKSVLVDGQRAKGVELGAVGRVTKHWSIAGGYAYQDGRLLATQSATVLAGARLAQLPRHTLSLWNRYDLTKQWGVGLGVIYRDAIFAATDNTVTLPGFVRVDAAMFHQFGPRLRAQLNVENVFDRGYFATANSNNNLSPGSPRAFRLSLTTVF
jgi:catecholate siderophore receptor